MGAGITTIKVPMELRDRLRVEADRDGLTLGELLDALLHERARARRFEELREAIESTTGEDVTTWLDETEQWDTTSSDGLGAA